MVYTGEPSMFWRDRWEAWTPTVPTHVLLSLPWPIHDVLQIPVPGMTKGNCLGLVTAGAVLCLLGQPRKALVDVNLPWSQNFEKYIWSSTWQEKENYWGLDLCWSWSEDNSMGACEGKNHPGTKSESWWKGWIDRASVDIKREDIPGRIGAEGSLSSQKDTWCFTQCLLNGSR